MSRYRWVLVVLVMALLVAAPSPATAETEARLTLDQCLRLALANNLDLVSARMNPAISSEQVTQEAAGYDSTINSTAFGNGFETEPFDEFTSAGIGHTLGVQGQWLKKFQFGGDIDTTLTSSRRTGAGSFFSRPPLIDEPFYQTTISASFNAELLRGRGKEPTTERLVLAKGNLEISREDLRGRAETTLETVEGAYWNLLAAIAALDVAEKRLGRAQDLLDLNRKKVDVGTLAPIEITQAKAGVADVQETVIVAQETLENAEDELLRLLAVPADDPMWDGAVVPVNRPSFVRQEIDLDAAIEAALAGRAEMTGARIDVKNKGLSERVAKNGVKHGLRLSLDFTPQGDSNNIDDLPASPVGDVADSLEEALQSDFFTWRGSATYSIPIGNRANQAGYRIAQINREKSEISLQNQEQTIRVEVRSAVRAVDSGILRVDAAQANVELQQEKLDAEQKKFANGMSTSFEVLTFQNDLADAQLNEIRAKLFYVKALAALERVKGNLLAARGMSLNPE